MSCFYLTFASTEAGLRFVSTHQHGEFAADVRAKLERNERDALACTYGGGAGWDRKTSPVTVPVDLDHAVEFGGSVFPADRGWLTSGGISARYRLDEH